MFNILDFLDSPDIREYNRETKFTPAEQAVLVAMSFRKTMDEKISALKELADAYREDEFQKESVETGLYCMDEIEFRKLVLDTVKWWEWLLEERYHSENMVYMAEFKEKEIRSDGDELFFSTYDKAYEYIMAEKKY